MRKITLFQFLIMTILVKNEKKTLAFISTYCTQFFEKKGRPAITNADTINTHWNRLLRDYAEVDHDSVKRYLNKINYKTVYLTTYWWYIIRHKRLLMDGFLCTDKNCCGDTHLLEIHHLNYDHRGEEINYMDSIITLCKTCHGNRHPEKKTRKKKRFWFKKKNNVVVLTKTEEQKDPVNLKEFQEKLDNLSIEEIKVVSEPKKYTVIITTQTPTTEELETVILQNMNILLTALKQI